MIFNPMKYYLICVPVFLLILVFATFTNMGYATNMNEIISQLNKNSKQFANNDNTILNNPKTNCSSEDSISNSCNINQCTTIGSNSCNNRDESNSIDTATILVEKVYRKGQDEGFNFEVTVEANNPHPKKFSPDNERPVTVIVSPGEYRITKEPITTIGRYYSQSYSEDCTGTIRGGETKICTITNTDDPAQLFVEKRIIGGPDDSPPAVENFNYTITYNDRQSGPHPFKDPADGHGIPAGPYNVEETGIVEGYIPSYSDNCSGNIRNEDSLTCVVTNTYIE